MNFVEVCRKVIGIDSTPAVGTRALATYLAELCKSKGLFVETHEDFVRDLVQINLVARPTKNRSEAEFMLQAHLDTPDPGPFGSWVETGMNPFDAHIKDGHIYGLGTADSKLDFLCKLEALASFPATATWKLPPVLVGTHSEESGMTGAVRLLKKNQIFPKKALIGEASGLKLVTAAKGIAHVEIRIPFEADENQYRLEHNLKESTSSQSKNFSGKPAHSSRPDLGESAIHKMFDYLTQLPEQITLMEIEGGTNFNTVAANAFMEIDMSSGHKFPMTKKLLKVYEAVKNLETEFEKYRDEEFTPAVPTLNIGIVRTFEDHVFLSGNCRVNPSMGQEIFEKWMIHLKEICRSVNGEFQVSDYKRPFRSEVNSPFVRGCLEELGKMGLSNQAATQASTNEASVFSRRGIECVCFGAGHHEDNSHTPKENVKIESLEKSIKYYQRVIERFCL